MSFTELLCEMLESAEASAPHPTVLATRVVLSRNLRETFWDLRSEAERQELRGRLFEQLSKSKALGGARYFEAEALEEFELRFLVENRWLDEGLLEAPAAKGAIIASDPRLAIVIGQEDHLRIQCRRDGLDLSGAFACADMLDVALEEILEYAFSEEFGYLTASPRRAGTGLQASVLMHLPALAMSDELPRIFRGLSALHLDLNPRQSGGVSALVEIGNGQSLGKAEADYLEDLRRSVVKLTEFETKARERLQAEAQRLLEDHVWTAYGQLRFARLMGSRRAVELLGALRMGCLAGIIEEVSLQEVQSIWLRVLDGHLQAAAGEAIEEDERDRLRAELLREWLANGREADRIEGENGPAEKGQLRKE